MEDNLPNYYTMHCDRCGANLLTKADYNKSKIIFAIAWVDRQIAKVLGVFRITPKRTTFRIQSDGKGNLNVTAGDQSTKNAKETR